MNTYFENVRLSFLNSALGGSILLSGFLISVAYPQSTITIIPQESQDAFRNPLKGFRGGEYGTTKKDYIKWSELENNASDGVQKIRDVCNNRWKNYPASNSKVIPRVYLQYGSSYWPADMTTGDYSSQQFQDRLVRLVSRLGEVWDNDPRVAYVEMGIFGNWGEQESPAPSPAMQKLAGDAFSAAFKNKFVMVRHTWDMFKPYSFGCYWDSWAHWGQRNHYTGLASTAPRWKIAPMGGEAAYNWGSYSIQPGSSPDITLSQDVHRNYLLKSIRELHGNHLGWVSSYDSKNATVAAGAKIIQKVFGHRFVIKQITYPKRLTRGQTFDVSFSVINQGSSPFYYKWPIELSLLDKTTKQPIYQRLFGNVDVTQWMPGDLWDSASQVYKTQAAVYEAQGRFNLPASLPTGQYILALAMVDPGGLKPSNRFAITNYFTGGRHPMGYVGVDQDVAGSFTIDPASFNSLLDNSLKYDIAQSAPFTLTLISPKGTLDLGAGTHPYFSGSSVTISALPNQGQPFMSWTGDVEGDASKETITVTMDRSKTITANFGPVAVSPKGPSNMGECFFSWRGHAPIAISQLHEIRKLTVYALSGNQVRSMVVKSNQVFWNGEDNSGQVLARGVYMVQLQGIENTYSTKIALTP